MRVAYPLPWTSAARQRALIVLLLFPLLALAAVDAFAAQDHVQGRRAALVIGNSAYATLPKLPNSVNDAKRIGEVLRDANFEVTIGNDLTKAGLEKTVRAFLQTLNDGDVALFYYSGHAVQVADQNFIIPVDASLSSAYDLEVESYNVTSLLDYMRATSGLQILVLDACRDNPFRNQRYYLGDRNVEVGKQGLASLVPKQGSLIVYSTAPDQVAYDGGGDLSPFAGAFADNLLSPNKEVREMLTLVRNAVMQQTGGRQIPWDVSSLTSQFYFVSAQEVLVLGESVTEVRASPNATRIRLDIQPPIASKGLHLTATFDKLPKSGMLLLDDKTIQPGEPIDAQRMGEIVYVTDPGQKSIELLPYRIESNTGQEANGAVAIVFDPTVPQQRDTLQQVASNVDGQSATKAVPVKLTLNADVGTGFKPVPALELGAGGGRPTGWFRLEKRDPAAQVAVGGELLMLGDLVKAEDLSRVSIRPAIHESNEEAQVVLMPAAVVPEAQPVVIKVEAEVNACDQLAAEPLDIQAVTEGVWPNSLQLDKAAEACRTAVADFPDIPRFKFQYGRVLYARGDYEGAVKMMRQALDGGHVRAGQFLGRLYQLGSGAELAPEKAIPLFEAAARRGDPYGQYSLGRALMDGNGVKKDVKRGIELMNKAVESGHTYALNQLGAEYLYGNRVPKDAERAYVMFEKSAGRGDVWGEVNLGLMYRDGVFVKQDKQRAYQLFEEANRKLHPYAATLMALMDKQEGRKDPAGLLALYRESASRGDGWGAFYAAEIVSAQPALAKDPDEAVRLYALAIARKAGDATKEARERLKAMPAERLAREAQKTLVRMGAKDIEPDGKIGPKVRAAAAKVLGHKPPASALDLYVDLVRQEWIDSTPRLDML